MTRFFQNMMCLASIAGGAAAATLQESGWATKHGHACVECTYKTDTFAKCGKWSTSYIWCCTKTKDGAYINSADTASEVNGYAKCDVEATGSKPTPSATPAATPSPTPVPPASSSSTSVGNFFAMCPGKTEKTSASSEKCLTDASSCTPGLCYTTPACCGSKTVSCDAATYRDAKKYSSALGASTANWQTNCCTTRATCSSATCPAGSKKKAGVDATKCTSDAASCNTWSIATTNTCCESDSTTCCGTVGICTMATSYNDKAKCGNAKGTDFQANCCTTKATCSSATCPAGYKMKAGDPTTKCSSDVASCPSTCCEATTCKSKTFSCSTGTYKDAKKVNSTAGEQTTDWQTNCCTTKATCSSATCPAGSKKKAGVDATKCKSDVASCNTWGVLDFVTNTCCENDDTTCCGTVGICTIGTSYNDKAKCGNAKGTDFQANCCTTRATCSMAWSEKEETSVATRGTVAAAAVGAIIVAMATLM